MRFKERKSDAFSVKDEIKGGEWWRVAETGIAVLLLLISDEFYTIAPSLLLHSQERHFSGEQSDESSGMSYCTAL